MGLGVQLILGVFFKWFKWLRVVGLGYSVLGLGSRVNGIGL